MKLRLRELRKERGLTQREVGDAAGYSTSYITEVENGTKQVNARMLENLSRALTVLGAPGGHPPVTPALLILDDRDTQDQELLQRIAALTPKGREMLLEYVALLERAPPR